MEESFNLLDFISYIITGATILVSLVSVFLTSHKTKRRKLENEDLEEEINNYETKVESLESLNGTLTKMEQITDYIQTAMETAEKSGINNGVGKNYMLYH